MNRNRVIEEQIQTATYTLEELRQAITDYDTALADLCNAESDYMIRKIETREAQEELDAISAGITLEAIAQGKNDTERKLRATIALNESQEVGIKRHNLATREEELRKVQDRRQQCENNVKASGAKLRALQSMAELQRAMLDAIANIAPEMVTNDIPF